MIKITINERIKILRTQILKNENGKNYSQRRFAEKIGVSPGVINNIDTNLVEAKDNVIKLICLTFNVNEEWLRNGTEPIFKKDKGEKPLIDIIEEEYNLNPLSKKIIDKYLNLDKEEQAIFEKFVIDLFEENNIPKSELTEIPKYTSNNSTDTEFSEELSITSIEEIREIELYNTPVSAGTGSFVTDCEYSETIQVDLRQAPNARRCDYALRVRGDSMEPYFYDGDIVYIKKQPTIENGQIGIFVYDDESYIKKLSVEKDGIYLLSYNENYKPIKINEYNTFVCCGLVL